MSTFTVTIDGVKFRQFDKAGLRYRTTTNSVKIDGKLAYPVTLTTKNGNEYTFYVGQERYLNEFSLTYSSAEDTAWDFPGYLNSKYINPAVGSDGPCIIITLGGKEFLRIPVADMYSAGSSGGRDKPQLVKIGAKNQDPYADNTDASYVFNVATMEEAIAKSSEASDMMHGVKAAGTIDFDPALNTQLSL